MKQPGIPRQQHTDLHPRLGPGLFDDERVADSIDRAAAAIAGFIANLPEDEKKLTRPYDDVIARKVLYDPIRFYWADNDYDSRVKLSDLKIQARQLRARVKTFDESMKILPAPLKSALRMSLTRICGKSISGENRFALAHEMNVAIICACDDLIKSKRKKTGERGVISLVEPLWNYWESMRTLPFRRSWNECETRRSLVEQVGPVSFSRTDALFVQVTIAAIDPTAMFSDIRTRLKAVAKKRSTAGNPAPAVGHRPRRSASRRP